MNFTEACEAVDDARRTIDKSNDIVRKVAGLAAGRLRAAGVDQYYLRQLKAELRSYNPHTNRWRDPK